MSRKATQLVEQPHGGALDSGGGQRGNKGGDGGIPKLVVMRCQTSFYKRVNILEKIADSKTSEDRDRLKALDMMGKYGRLEVLTIDDGREKGANLAGEQLFASLLPMAERLLTLAIASRPAETVQKLAAIEAQVVE